MISIALAALLGLAAFPVMLLFGPVYFPWSLLVLASLGGAVGLSIEQRGPVWRSLRALGLAVLMVAVVLGMIMLTSNVRPSPDVLAAVLVWTSWLFFPILMGLLVGAWLRAKTGTLRGARSGAAVVFATALAGAGLALAFAPAEVAAAPTCGGGFDCPRTRCAHMAERRRFLAIERVTAYDGEHITCRYTAWGGIYIGRADMDRRGGSWTDGAWPEFVSGRGR